MTLPLAGESEQVLTTGADTTTAYALAPDRSDQQNPVTMHRYKLEFVSQTLDETALRNVLEREFRVSSLSILRETTAPAAISGASRPSELRGVQFKIVDLLANGEPWRQAAIIDRLNLPRPGVARNIGLLLRSGRIEKVRHGVYILSGKPHPQISSIPDLPNRDPAKQKEVLDLLGNPLSQLQLRDLLNVSRQRVEQILSKLEELELVRKYPVVGEKGRFVYLRADVDARAALRGREPDRIEGIMRARILSSMRPSGFYGIRDILAVVNTSQSAISQCLSWLEREGMIYCFEFSRLRYSLLTPKGLKDPHYQREAPKASPADILEDFGTRRLPYLQHLSVLGQARTRDLTDSLDGRRTGDASLSGQILANLEASKIVQIASHKPGEQPYYSLTKKGSFIVDLINSAKPPPDKETLLSRISHQQSSRSANLANRARLRPSAQHRLTRELLERGELTKRAISNLRLFKHPKSVDLALKTLEKRGEVQRRRICIDDREVEVWSASSFSMRETRAPQPTAAAS